MMSLTDELARHEAELERIKAVQHALEKVQMELVTYRAALRRHLGYLQRTEAAEIEHVEEVPEPAAVSEFRSTLLGTPPLVEFLPDRRIARRRVGNPISILIASSARLAEPVSGWVADRSQSGLGLWSDEQEEVGSILTVRPSQESDEDWWARVVVRHCRQENRGSWVLGCQFLQPLSWKHLKQFG